MKQRLGDKFYFTGACFVDGFVYHMEINTNMHSQYIYQFEACIYAVSVSTLSYLLRVLVLLDFDSWELHCFCLFVWFCLIFGFSFFFLVMLFLMLRILWIEMMRGLILSVGFV